MLPWTLDDHFTFGYNSGIFNHKEKTESSTLWCKYSRCKREPGNFREECIRTAELLASAARKLQRVPVVMLSGGMDSEVVVKSFIEANVNFETLTFRFENGLNSHELRFVNAFLSRHHIIPKFFDLDSKWIQTNEAAVLMDQSGCSSANMLNHLKLMSHIWNTGGMPILGNGDVYFEKKNDRWEYAELDYMLTFFRHAINNEILGGIGFFQHTPEITLSMLREPRIERLGLNKDSYATRVYDTSRFIKYCVYRKYWPDLLIRPKFGGQELIKDFVDARTNELLTNRKVHFKDKFFLEYTTFRNMLEP